MFENALQIAKNSLSLVLMGKAKPTEAAQQLMALAAKSRALAIGNSFATALETAGETEAGDMAERHGRQLEQVLDEMPEEEIRKTLTAMVEEGDIDIVLAMVKGNAAGTSTAAGYLTAKLIEDLFEKDPEINSEDASTAGTRALYLCWTLVMEVNCAGVVHFFAEQSITTEKICGLLTDLAKNGDEEAQMVVRRLDEKLEDLFQTDEV